MNLRALKTAIIETRSSRRRWSLRPLGPRNGVWIFSIPEAARRWDISQSLKGSPTSSSGPSEAQQTDSAGINRRRSHAPRRGDLWVAVGATHGNKSSHESRP
jgi:hypothetical protein